MKKPALFQVMVLGTGSHAGKTMLAAGLCRILSGRGLRTAPFKAQNMALNSGVTLDGAEISRAQILQAEAARVLPSREMNPVLLKPSGVGRSQVIVNGRPQGLMTTRQYHRYWPKAAGAARRAYASLCEAAQALVIEGAGSPAEVNLMHRDLANIETARFSGAPFILAADIERGGSFAAVSGTMHILPAWMRRRCAGVVFNKFRGDSRLLKPGIAWLKKRHGLRTLGVLPFFPGLDLEQEDSLGLPPPAAGMRPAGGRKLRVEVLRVASLANADDVLPLMSDSGLELRWREPGKAGSGHADPDLVVLPGNKFTLSDMRQCLSNGEARRLRRLHGSGSWMLGICGGLQMLGRSIDDAAGVDGPRSPRRVAGLGLLDLSTSMHPEKITAQAQAAVKTPLGSFKLKGYEIHHGRSRLGPGAQECAAGALPGRPMLAAAPGGRVYASYLHGLLHNQDFRLSLLKAVASSRRRGYQPRPPKPGAREALLDRWAAHMEKHLELSRIPGFPPRRGPGFAA